jgi:hypothetical protein
LVSRPISFKFEHVCLEAPVLFRKLIWFDRRVSPDLRWRVLWAEDRSNASDSLFYSIELAAPICPLPRRIRCTRFERKELLP